MSKKSNFKTPTVTVKGDGTERLVGFELEFSGLSLAQTVEIVKSSLDGSLGDKTAAEQIVHVESLGDFNIELDWDFLKRIAEDNENHGEDPAWFEQLSKAASMLVPVEVVSPPISINHLNVLEPMILALREAGAMGTEESLIAAYGVHINADIPKLDAETLFAYLRSFAVLQWWLVEAHQVNAARKISPYIDLYPESYVKLLLSQSAPNMDQIFSDYLEFNASRNRALDLLPMLAEIDKERVFDTVDDPKIKARPAFHYRLSNCNIEHKDWSLARSWNTWWIIEQLAHRPDDLKELSTAFLDAEQPIIGVIRTKWVNYLDQWLKDHRLV
ncbi:amidoligase family protein [Colwelliaceae bacterium 6471]